MREKACSQYQFLTFQHFITALLEQYVGFFKVSVLIIFKVGVLDAYKRGACEDD